jgi:hypothetical protein
MEQRWHPPRSMTLRHGVFTPTGGLATARGQHTATLLENDGKVLLAGGWNPVLHRTAELYNPSSGTFSSTGNMSTHRNNHTATLLEDGTVLIAGGWGEGSDGAVVLNSAEIYNPSSGSFASTSSMAPARASHTATLLPDGKVHLVGGSSGTDSSS